MDRRARRERKWLGRIALSVLAVAGTLIVAMVGFFYWFDNFSCDARDIMRVVSPDGRWEAVSYQSSCGGQDFERALSVVPTGKAVTTGGNVYSARHGYATPVWLGPDKLAVRYTAAGEIFKIEKRHGPVSIAYRLTPIAYRTDAEVKALRAQPSE